MTALTDLPAEARIRLTSIAPAMLPEHAAQLLSAIEKLFQQFLREDRIRQFAADLLGDGHVLAIAWVDAHEPLSGCSHDKLGQVLQAHETRSGCRLLDAPPIVINTTNGLRCVDRIALKKLVHNGEVNHDCLHWNLRVETMAEWRAFGQQPARLTWLGPLIQRLQQVG
jgi:hypothetical protein